MQDNLIVWADECGLAPTQLFAGYITEVFTGGVDAKLVREQLKKGVKGIWFPVASHANTVAQVGGRPFWWGASRTFSDLVGPVPFAIARACE